MYSIRYMINTLLSKIFIKGNKLSTLLSKIYHTHFMIDANKLMELSHPYLSDINYSNVFIFHDPLLN